MRKIYFFIVLSFYVGVSLTGCKKLAPTLSVASIDDKGIYVGEGKSGFESPTEKESQWAKTVNALNQGWEYIRLGNSYDTAGQYQEAIEAYKKAYEADPGNRVFIGDHLIEAYEKTSRYDEAIAVVDEILKTQHLAKKGMDDFSEIRTRLLAAKAQSNQS